MLVSKVKLIFVLAGMVVIEACNQRRNEFVSGLEGQAIQNIVDSKLDSFFTQKFPVNDPGGAVFVRTGDRVLISKGYGISDIKTHEKVTAHTLFNLGSITKTFVSNAILVLQERGKLSIEDNLSKYFSGFENTAIAQSVKIRHLLTHTSGLPDIRFPWKDSVFYLTAKDNENWAPIMKAQRLNFEPGSRFEYSNPAFNALALIIEKVSNEKWQLFVTNNIFLPSGMATSTITDGPHPQEGVAHGYEKSKNGWIEKDYGEEPTFAAAGNGGVWSSIEELDKYESALRKGTFLPIPVIKESRTPKNDFEANSNLPVSNLKFTLGYSWFVSNVSDQESIIGHFGWQGGFRATYVCVPQKDWLIVILSAAPRPLEEYANWVLNCIQAAQ